MIEVVKSSLKNGEEKVVSKIFKMVEIGKLCLFLFQYREYDSISYQFFEYRCT